MDILQSPDQYLFNLHTANSADARRLWKQQIREKWEYKCAYCESTENLTIDHVIPQCKGGKDITKNVVCCCHSCNQSKGHQEWKLWYVQQSFYNEEKFNKIEEWVNPDSPISLFTYPARRNNLT